MELKKRKYTGFASYLETHEITKEFVKDYEYWMRRYFRKWNLFIDFDEFKSICWEALIEDLPNFDPEVATIQTFCISRINNECLRKWMKNKTTKPEDDFDDPVINCEIQARPSLDVSYFNAFSKHAYNLGVKVDIETLSRDYLEGYDTDAVKAFCWWMMREKLK